MKKNRHHPHCKKYKTSAVKRQCCCLRKIYCKPKITWFERMFKLIICAAEFLNISLYIREIIRDKYRKGIIDLYVLLMSIVFPILVLVFGWQESLVVLIITLYLLSTSLIYLLGIVFLDDVYRWPHSKKRSLLLVFANYMGITLYFSILYQYFNAVKDVCGKVISNLEAVYFSFVTSTTLGFGDYKPCNSIGQILVILQVCIFLLFIVVFFNHFINLKQKE